MKVQREINFHGMWMKEDDFSERFFEYSKKENLSLILRKMVIDF